jgi:hypothetical protein
MAKVYTEEEIKLIGKIPVGDYCYGSALEDKGEEIEGKRVFKTIRCPYHTKPDYCSNKLFLLHKHLIILTIF